MSANLSKPWFIIAPHLLFPLYNGADVYVEGVAKGISSCIVEEKVILFGCNEILHYQHGKIVQRSPFKNKLRSKFVAVIRTLIFKSSYQCEKFITTAYIKELKRRNFPKECNVIYSFNSSILISKYLALQDAFEVVLTHNFDLSFFIELANNSNNAFIKKVFKTTACYTEVLLKKNQQFFNFTHINSADLLKYQNSFPLMRHYLLKAGIDVPDIDQILQEKKEVSESIKLCFCGGLSSIQNLQALQYFATMFWPILILNFKRKIQFIVIGSNPLEQVTNLCRTHNWLLEANVSERKFRTLVTSSHFSILPFEHTSGSKLKLLTCMGLGTPFLATTCIRDQLSSYPENCFFSDIPNEWTMHLHKWVLHVKSKPQVLATLTYASAFNWSTLCGQFLNSVSEIAQN